MEKGQNWREEEYMDEGEVEVAVPSHKKLYPQPYFYKENEFCIKVHSKKRRKPNPKYRYSKKKENSILSEDENKSEKNPPSTSDGSPLFQN